jgi:flagellar assembly protein FliH
MTILRDTIFSEQLRTVGRPRREVPAPVAHFEAVAESEVAVGAEVEPLVSGLDMLETLAHPPVSPRETRLSFESVTAWLAVQDAETRLSCAQILDTELTQVHEAAKAAGIEAGRAQGLEEIRKTADALFATLQSLTHSADSAYASEQAKLADSCVEIITEAFAKIAGTLLPAREATVQAVTQVLQRVKEGRELTVRVSPADLPTLHEEETQLAAAIPGRKFTLVADPRIELGGCMVDSKLGSLDGRLEVQLRELYETLRAAKSSSAERA